ncbi:MAG: sigma-54 dependent transcriptional regulator [Desulfovibrio sp.]|jgi:DNA-binding NtrC family response regulator|nr:sigma-54 dependent transcriptional regulator [Desulfovibrio sp.]
MTAQRILFLAPAQTVTRIFPQLREAGLEVGIAENLKGASSFMRKGLPVLILSRPFLPGFRIEDLLLVGRDDPEFPPVIVFSDRPAPEEAARLMELGARDYWAEPLSFEKISAVLPPSRQPAQPAPSSTFGGKKTQSLTPGRQRIVGAHPVIRRVLSLARQVAKSRATVLISGESGTGKEMFARYLHAESDRAERAFVAVNCAALPEHLLESELFGHEKGAFTGAIARKLGKFELASGGTILLDEISEMDLALQAKLLRVLQEGEIDRVGGAETLKVDVRVIATTNRDLEAWVEEGRFRQDLFFRLNVIPLRLPALRERGDDVLLLARFFVDLYLREYVLAPVELSEEARTWLLDYAWPGNVRELQNLMERAVLLSGGQAIRPGHFLLENEEWPLFAGDGDLDGEQTPQSGEADAPDPADGWTEGSESDREAGRAGEEAGSLPGTVAFSGGVIPLYEMERIMIRKGLEQTGGNRTQAAELLGISVRTLRNKLNEYREAGLGLDTPEK